MKRAIVALLALIAILIMGASAAMADGQQDSLGQPGVQTSASQAVVPQKYGLHSADVIKMTVWGEPNLSTSQVVDPAGYVNLPKLGAVFVQGMSVEDLIAKVKSGLSEWIRDPKVEIELMQAYKTKVYVLGEGVRNPGPYDFRTGDRVLEAIALAGGYTDIADLSKAELWHRGADQKKILVNLAKLFYEGEMSQNYELQDGDTIRVPEDTMGKYAVVGEVLRQGQFRLKKNVTVMDAISSAGGATDRADLASTYILRAGPKGAERICVDMKKFVKKADLAQNIEIKPGDVVYVAETSKPNWDKVSKVLASVVNTSWLFRIW
ncbi:MAG TPA: polysaccharide biosynthesis/export family protein [Armatimonadota bacterium]|jgi:polysaccharide export outer membrane protein